MFHEVLIVSGVSESKAAVLFAGVLIGSGKWLEAEAEAGKSCPTIRGVSCINADTPGGAILIRQPSSFGTPEYNELFDAARTQILSDGLTDPIPVLELIRELSPNDIYFENTGGTLGGAQEF